jgi:hypothetical protein
VLESTACARRSLRSRPAGQAGSGKFSPTHGKLSRLRAFEALHSGPDRVRRSGASRYNERVMFCPQCGAEYRSGFVECSDCQIKLVEQLPPATEGAPAGAIVTILEVDPLEYDRVQAMLEEAGIECFSARDDGMSTVMGTRLFSGVRVQVRQADAQRARRLLSQLS